ncbi:MAG TPA: NAD(P)/FAD-dependent oxidoreductase [Candidatus Saccharimonadales bacterium]|nr:NAD(P)/FAD-dependent oxidoreductase [Candidatus Saccharimonadales bacterium]
MSSTNTKIVIVGGGFAGVKTALELAGCTGCEVTLVSEHSHFRYYPGLYHTATGGRRAGSRIALENILQGSGVRFVRAQATKLDRKHKHIKNADGQSIPFDTLVLALGNVTNYFGITGLADYSYGIKSTEEVERFKKHLHQQIAETGGPDLNYVIVGGGPTGIELAGALPGYLHHIMQKHGVQGRKLHIELVEAAPTLLPRSPKEISQAVAKRLQALGVKLMLGTAVQGETADMLMAGDKPLKSHTVVWTASVTNHPFFKDNSFKLTDRGKVEVDEFLQAEPNIFVLGDNANTPYSGMAQTALHDAELVAKNIRRATEGQPPEHYTPKKPISVIPVGPHWAAVEWGKARFAGFWGWVLHLLADLIAFHDLESWPKAGEQWMTNMQESDADICPTCTSR